MKPSEIILNDKNSIRDGADKVLSAVMKIVQDKAGIILQQNDSILLLANLGKNNAELHLYTLDPPLKLARSLKYFIDQIKASDLKRVYGTIAFDAPILRMLRDFGIDIQKSDNPKYQWMAKV
jgi:hypothetical protein